MVISDLGSDCCTKSLNSSQLLTCVTLGVQSSEKSGGA